MNIQVHPHILFLPVLQGQVHHTVILNPELLCDVDENHRLLSIEAIGHQRLTLLDTLDAFGTDRLTEDYNTVGESSFSEQEAIELFTLLQETCQDC